MPYDENDNWTPDPEDEIYTDPDASKYIDENGNDTRFGRSYNDGTFYPDHPEIIKLKKSGKWAKIPPIQRRWLKQDLARLSKDTLKDLKKIRDK
jgi:hypothetical protein